MLVAAVGGQRGAFKRADVGAARASARLWTHLGVRPRARRQWLSSRLSAVRGGAAAGGEDDEHALVRRLYALERPARLVVHSTGAGGHLAAWLLSQPGASSLLVDFSIPYGRDALVECLGGVPPADGYCAATTAQGLARTAHRRAVTLRVGAATLAELAADGAAAADRPPVRHVGLGCAASLATSEPKRGAHRAFISACWDDVEVTHEVVLEKGTRSRAEEERLVSSAALHALERALGAADGARGAHAHCLRAALAAQLTCAGDSYTLLHAAARAAPIDRLLAGDASLVLCLPAPPAGAARAGERERAHGGDGEPTVGSIARHSAWCDVPVRHALVLPGSFNPLHDGHARMAAAAVAACALAGKGARAVVFEITARNADKGALDRDELSRRVEQFATVRLAPELPAGAPLALTRARLFAEKASLFPGCTFVVGADTAARLVDPKYYADSEAEMGASLAAIRAHGCDFLVAGRVIDGEYTTLEQLLPRVPASMRPLFAQLREDGSAFRVDVSSTQLRQAARDAQPGAGAGAAAVVSREGLLPPAEPRCGPD